MKNKSFVMASATTVILGFIALRLWPEPTETNNSVSSNIETLTLQQSNTSLTGSKQENVIAESSIAATSTVTVADESQTTKDSSIKLTSGNFESFVNQCFLGEDCTFSDDPISMYRNFKISRNDRACDNLISFLRSKMRDEEHRLKYKDVLKKMIDDFYSPQEKQFQEAAYFNYLGDLQKSLDLYLDLERKAKNDPSLRPAPKLNIANTFYDLKRYKDALPYYQAALSEYVEREQEVAIPTQNEMIRFIEARIEDVNQRL